MSDAVKDYNHAEDPQYKKLRDLAEKEYDRRKELADKSQSAYKSGDGASAKQFSEQAKQHEAKAEDYNRQAAEFVFRANNADSREDEIDLHGLYVKEALQYLDMRIQAARSRRETHIKAIVGKGIHSQNHVAKIKPAVEDLCRKHNFRYSTDPHNSGVLVIDLTSGGGEVPYNNIAPNPQWSSHPNTGGYPQQYGNQNQPYHQQQQNYGGNNNNSNNSDLMGILCALATCFIKRMK